MDFDNPAYRLLTLLQNGKKIDGNINCGVAWAQLLGVSHSSPDLYVRLGKVMELPSQIVSALQYSYPDEEDTWSHWVNQVQTGFQSQVLNQSWATFINSIDNHSINYLKMHSRHLQHKSKVKPVDEEVLMTAKNELLEVLELLLANEDIDKEVRVYLSRNIRKLIIAIEEYQLTGSAGIFDSIEILYGHTVFDQKYAAVIKETPIGEKVTGIVSVLADSMTIAVGLPQLSASLKPLLAFVQTVGN
jgi:hypothetical protein